MLRNRTPLERIRNGFISLAIVFSVAVFGYHFLGNYSWLESVWLVVITISTVGFGEQSSLSDALQVLTIGVILFGVSASVYTIGGFIQLALEGEVDRALGRRKLTKEIMRLRDHVIVCGFGRLGEDLANQLKHRKTPFVVIDTDREKVSEATELGFLAIHGDAMTESILEQVNIQHAKTVVSALPTDAENVFIALTARNLCSDIQIVTKSEHRSSYKKLIQAGADRVVMPHRVGAQQMERMISRPSTADLVELFSEVTNHDMELDEIQVSQSSHLIGKTVATSELRSEHNLLILGIRSADGEFRFNPGGDEPIGFEDTLLVVGGHEAITQLRDLMTEPSR
jgi:voltage-gated potassium channel